MTGGFFITFLGLMACFVWCRWLAGRQNSSVTWAPWVPGAATTIWALALIFAATGLVGTGSLEGMNMGLTRMFNASRIADYIVGATFLAMIPITALAFLRPRKAAPEA